MNKKKVMTIVVALFLLFAMAVSLVAVPNANAANVSATPISSLYA